MKSYYVQLLKSYWISGENYFDGRKNNWYVLGPSFYFYFYFFSDRRALKFLKKKCNLTNKNAVVLLPLRENPGQQHLVPLHNSNVISNIIFQGYLLLHRTEPALKHQDRVQTLCDVTMHYFGSNLKLDYERTDPRDEVMIEQQHCGGNTLVVFREQILAHSKNFVFQHFCNFSKAC